MPRAGCCGWREGGGRGWGEGAAERARRLGGRGQQRQRPHGTTWSALETTTAPTYLGHFTVLDGAPEVHSVIGKRAYAGLIEFAIELVGWGG